MYRVLCDGQTIHDLRDEELTLIDPKATLEVNTAGSFEFKLPPNHPQYNLPQKMKSLIQVFHDEEEIFAGRIVSDQADFYNRKNMVCEGQLAYLNDSVQRPHEYHDMTVRGYLEALIAVHNQQVDASRQFEVGIVTVTDNNDSLYRYTNYENTLTAIKEDLIDDLGGYVRVRNHNGHRYIDYIKDFDNVCTQSIQFGENLLDCSRNIDLTDIATAIIPLGTRLEESDIAALEKRLTIESVNKGVDYLTNDEAVAKYGFIVKTVTWDDVTTPEMLLSKGRRWLTDEQFENMVIEIKAVDLHYTDEQIEQFKLFDMIPVHSTPHGLNRNFPLSKMTVNLTNPAGNTFTLGTTVKTSLTAKTNQAQSAVNKAIETIPVPSSIVQQAIAEATALITAATHGHVVTTAEEQLIMDTTDVNTATRVWRWNLNGFGYSGNGYNGTYKTAITMDGWIVGERIAANSISGDKLEISYKTQVTKEIADAEEAARSDAQDYTDGELKKYYTKSEVETSIKNTADSVILSAKETATQYVDGKLKNYYTAAQIDVKTNSIESTVRQKLNSSDLSTKIQQSATAVKIAWNNISKYIQFESGELRIYDSAVTATQKIVSKFNYNGSHFYRDGMYIGNIGTNNWTGDASFRGLVFDLENQAKYMCWSSKDSDNANAYTVRLIYYQDDTKHKKGLHFSCPTYSNGNLYLTNDYRVFQYAGGGVGYDGSFYFGGGVFIQKNSTFGVYGGSRFVAYNNVTIDMYSPIDMHGFAINNQSDARMKKNIQPTKVNALKVLNAFDLKEFDWVQDGTHEDIGVIAQQLQQVIPDLVQEEKDGHLSIKTTKFIFYLIKAIQELSGDGYEKVPWSDPYTLLDKKIFCAKLEQSNPVKDDKPIEPETITIPIKKGS